MSKWINKFLKKESLHGTDRTDKPIGEGHLSVLSVPPQGVLAQKLDNIPRTRTDRTDKPIGEGHLSALSAPPEESFGIPSLADEYEERIAIAEVDGNQNPKDAYRIAYLDAFISLLYDLVKDDPHQDWLVQKIQTALATLESQNFPVLH